MPDEKGMDYIEEDEITGEKIKHSISYSQVLQKKIAREIKISNYLKIILIIATIIMITLGYLIVADTGVVGILLRKAICNCMTPA